MFCSVNDVASGDAIVSDMNVTQSQDGVTPLHLACRYNSADVTQYLLFRQADINAADAKGRTPLHYATRRGNDLVTKAHCQLYCRCVRCLLITIRHYAWHKMWPVTTVVARSVCLCVCWSQPSAP